MVVASIIIPAHNEGHRIGRHLAALRMGTRPEDLDVVVVCHGCTDSTAEVARRADPSARVIEIPLTSRAEADSIGSRITDVFPRVHLGSDVELTGADVLELVGPLAAEQALATAPRRAVPRHSCSRWVRWYYDVWEVLPHVETGLFGRGVVVLSEEAEQRLATQPAVLRELCVSQPFPPEERRIVPTAVAVWRPPTTVADLVRQKSANVVACSQACRAGVLGRVSRTRVRTLLSLAVARPGIAVRLPVFLGVCAMARLAALTRSR